MNEYFVFFGGGFDFIYIVLSLRGPGVWCFLYINLNAVNSIVIYCFSFTRALEFNVIHRFPV